MKYYDVFGEPGYHSAFLTTFSFTAQAFEDIAFSKLRGAGCRNVTVLADQSMLNVSIEEFGTPRFAGSLYHLAKVSVPGAFHPKITLLLGEKKGRLLVGSANLTALGIAGNKELIGDLVYTHEDPSFRNVFQNAFDYIASYAPAEDPWIPLARERALELSPWLVDDGAASPAPSPADVSLIVNRPTETILEQVITSVGDDEIQRLIVMSPYWDRKLEGLRQLREVMGMPPTDVLLERSRGEFPTHNFKSGTGIEIFNVEEERKTRFNHAKLIVALGRDWDHVISGSINCTVPALLGNTVSKGNAEAGFYKRVVAGTALAGLGLEEYQQAPLDPSSLAEPVSTTAEIETKRPIEPGTFQLRGSKVFWNPPQALRKVPICVSTFDGSGDNPWDDFVVQTVGEASWSVDLTLGRPRSARLQLADGSFSAAAVVIDVDVLAASTLPSKAGKKAKVVDKLLGTTHEDLALVGFLAELEAIEMDEVGSSKAKFNKGHENHEKDAEPWPDVTLTYEDFVKARERADAAKEKGIALAVGRSNRAADLVSSCLNRLIGLVSRDLSEEEDAELQRVVSQDPTHNEPSAPPDQDPNKHDTADSQSDDARRTNERSRDYSAKIVEAVTAFEARTKALRGKTITTIELVRLRLLLQIILNYAEPVTGGQQRRRVLPVADKSGHGWPRLIGRLLMRHFGTFLALKDIRLEEDENEQTRILEYLATAYYAAQVARQAVERHPRADVLRKPMVRLTKAITQQAVLVVNGHQDDQKYIGLLLEKLDHRFGKALGISNVPPLPGSN